MNEKIKNILSVYVLRLQWLIYDLKTCSLNEDPITLHLTGGDITISLNPKTKTTMNRQQAKELLPIIQAFAEGKTVQYKTEKEWIQTNVPTFNPYLWEYRIKPEPKYRPFKDAEECWQEMQKHQPFGWVKDKINNQYHSILSIDDYGITLNLFDENPQRKYKDTISQNFLFADGTPFGIKE